MAKAQKATTKTKVALWNAIVVAAVRAAKGDRNSLFSKAIFGAEENANDTLKDAIAGGASYSDAEYEEEFAGVAYGSLSLTGAFDEHKEVRDFFEGIGYRW